MSLPTSRLPLDLSLFFVIFLSFFCGAHILTPLPPRTRRDLLWFWKILEFAKVFELKFDFPDVFLKLWKIIWKLFDCLFLYKIWIQQVLQSNKIARKNSLLNIFILFHFLQTLIESKVVCYCHSKLTIHMGSLTMR